MITFSDVTKFYSNGNEALSKVNFHLEKGEMAFLTGHSGAGKSTVLKLIILAEKYDQGEVIINGQNIKTISARKAPYFRRSMGVIFQSPHLLNDRTVFDNVALPLVIAGVEYHHIRRRVGAALEKVGLRDKEKRFPFALSSGEQQRVGIARAIVHKPPLLLADEPTGNLDPALSFEIMKLFQALNEVGVTVLVVSHDLGLISQMPHRIITLKEGRILSDGNED